MTDLLYETVKRRDYRIEFRFGCRVSDCKAPAHVTIFLHRTKEELENGIRNINQRCAYGHISKPLRQCNKCNEVYSIEDSICIACESRARTKAILEIRLEGLERDLNRKELKDKKSVIEDEIKSTKTELEQIGK